MNWLRRLRGGSNGGLLVNFGWLMFDRVGRMMINLVVGVAVARHLGPADFGVLSFATALTSIFAVLVGLGIDEILVRDLVRERQRSGAWKAAWQLRLAAAAVAYLGALLAACLWRGDSPRTWGVVAIVAAGLLFAPADLLDLWFQARGQMKPPAMARQLALWLAGAWRLVLVAIGAPLNAFALASVVEAAMVAIALTWAFRNKRDRSSPAAAASLERWRLLREGWPMLASGLLVTITMQADRLLLSRYGGDAVVGIYAVAARVTEVFYAVPLALGAAVMPQLAALRLKNEAGYWRLARQVFVGLGAAGIGCSALISGLAFYLVPLIFGERYTAAVHILAIHVWSLTFVFLVSLRSRLLVIEGGTRWVLVMSLLTALIDVAGNFVLIPRYGGVGAAWTTVIAWAFSALVAPWFFPMTREVTRKTVSGVEVEPREAR
jgi:PST family polysaccharide transporter